MNCLQTLPSALAALAIFSTAGLADPGEAPATTAPMGMAPEPPAEIHDWTGWYGDIYAARWVYPGVIDLYGGNIGFLTSRDQLLFGAELRFENIAVLGLSMTSVNLRIGAPVGDRAMIYAGLGTGASNDAFPFNQIFLGGQYAFTEAIFARAEVVKQRFADAELPLIALHLGLGWQF